MDFLIFFKFICNHCQIPFCIIYNSINMPSTRTIENPIVKDKVTFLETSTETNGAYTHILIELAPSGGAQLHYHDDLEEEFEALKGELTLVADGQTIVLQPSEKFLVKTHVVHAFYNRTNAPIQFKTRITPNARKFEQFLQIMYGLARAGKTNSKGIPTNFWDIAAVGTLSQTYPPKGSFLAMLTPLLQWLGKKAVQRGRVKELIERYVEF